MSLSKNFNFMMASVVSFSLAASPMIGAGTAQAQTAPAAQAPADAGWQKDFDAWRTASKANTADAYKAYLGAYPSGKFAGVAKSRMNEFSGTAPAQTAKADQQTSTDVAVTTTGAITATANEDEAQKKRDLDMWRQVSNTGTQADYEKYLKAFPQGKFAKVAKGRLDALVADANAPVTQPVTDAAQNTDIKAQASEQPADASSSATVVQDESAQMQDQTKAPTSDWEQEYALWKAASDGNTIPEYEAYLKTYPNGKFAAIAQARIVQLTSAEQPAGNVAEGDTTQDEQSAKVKQDQASGQNQMANAEDDQTQQSDVGQSTQNGQGAHFTVGTPGTEMQFLVTRASRHEMQGRLTSLGFNTFGTDGAFGPNTRNAIGAWQQANNAPATGYLSGDQIAQIRIQSQVSYAQWVAAHPVIIERPVVVRRPIIVRPRRTVIVEERVRPNADAAIAAGIIGGVIGATVFHGPRYGRCHRHWC